jgi:predicted XRE-type DNA-binding protein
MSQVALAEYLEVTQGFISQMEKEMCPIPDWVISKILDNPNGWDTSMLTQSRDEVSEVVEKKIEVNITDRLLAIIEDQKRDTQMLLGMLREKDYEIKRLREELNERKKGVAPSADHSLSANAI